ncbi:hypothetical protein QJS10_CPA06g01601 [Acorus calamus]|uniref:Uncharacterized protein n=1 Tax=Acorus calamus TaxID=4465 RepID=A0AAV9EMC2_ACOCL|nr:hypothetical protein QJS10_CPA06g01601 [Acorus calamus]
MSEALEVLFCTSFASNPKVPNHIRLFFSAFHGTVTLPASDDSGPHPHLVLEDLVHGLLHPYILDLKIGSWSCYLTFVRHGVNALLYVMRLQGLAEGSSPIGPNKFAASSSAPRTLERPICSTALANGSRPQHDTPTFNAGGDPHLERI